MSITLSGHQLKSLLEFANPDGENDLDQLETELTIAFLEDGHSGKGYYFWMTEYPKEGCMFLSDLEPAMPEEILNQHPEGATHWQAGVYYRVSKYGVWAKWDGSWITSFKWPDGVMTPLSSGNLEKALKGDESK